MDSSLAEHFSRTAVQDAARALANIPGAVHRTPVLTSEQLNTLYGKQFFFKAENLQKVGAFKARGATYAMSRLSPEQRSGGVLTYSSGNHAQAVARAARLFGCPATIFMPEDAPAPKVAAVRGYGAEIVFAGTTSDHRKRACLDHAVETGAAILEPFDHPHIMAGQGTATLELLQDVPDLDSLYVPVGGGGVASGACLAAWELGSSVQIHTVEPLAACSLYESLQAGHPVPIQPLPTIADGLKPVQVGKLPFQVLQAAGVQAECVDDAELLQALKDLLTYAKVLVEPSGAAGLAAARKGTGKRVGVILTGGNVDLAALGGWLAS